MKNLIATTVLAASLSVPASAQLDATPQKIRPITASPVKPAAQERAKPATKRLERIQYALRQADLKPEQITGIEGLIETHFTDAEIEEQTPDIDKVRAIWKELELAKGDIPKVQALEDELRRMGKQTERLQGEDEFFANVNKVLSSEQQRLLKHAIERLDSDPSGELRPIDVLRTARALSLDEKSTSAIDAVESRFRNEINSRDASAGRAEERRGKLLEGLLQNVSSQLAEDKKPVFERRIRAMRPEMGHGIKILDADIAPGQ